ncbi:MAG: hypothetical protein R3195_14285 [Gemmatimonadota bacterium]|nr:hypothetical protein [Gemmatimonadota bacterium]
MKSTLSRGAAAIGVAALLGTSVVSTTDAVAQATRIEESAVTLSSGSDGRAELWVRLEDGSEHRLAFADGSIVVDGGAVGTYEPSGELVAEWREFLREHAGAEAAELEEGLVDLSERLGARDADEEDAESWRSLGRKLLEILRDVLEDDAEATAQTGPRSTISAPDGSRLTIAPGGVQLDELLGQLDRLRGALEQLGGAAARSTDNLALIVHDDFAIGGGEAVDGNLALLGGELDLAGEVRGNVLILDGELLLDDGARIEGDVLQVGGDLSLDGESITIVGEIVSDFPATGVAEAPRAERADETPVARERADRVTRGSTRRGPVARFARNLGRAGEGLMGALTFFVTLGAIGLLLVYFAQSRLETVADTVRHEFARSFAMGLAAEVLFFPALIVLCVLVITWPIVPFFVFGTGLALVAGYLAVAHGAGEMFARRRYRYEWLERIRRSNSYYYMLSGLVLLLLPFAATAVLWILGGTAGFVRGIVAFLAAVGTWILMTAGFGSLLLTRAGSRSVVVDWSDAGSHTGAGFAVDDFDVRPGAGGSSGDDHPGDATTSDGSTGPEGEGPPSRGEDDDA